MEPFFYTISAKQTAGDNPRFWAACGTDSLYPQIFTESGKALLSRLQEHGTCRYLRNHHTLSGLAKDGFENAGGDVYSETEDGTPVYHFEKINAVFREYLRYGMKPVVELDFLPEALSRQEERGGEEEGIYLNRSYPKDWGKWQDLLKAFMKNLADTFGKEELRTWYFEVWNEADGWPAEDWPKFHRMYDIFADAVLGTDEKLRVGGPGSFRQDFLRDFLEHVTNGRNYVTGEKGARIDFISHHIYGMSGSWLGEYPLVMPTVQRFCQEILWLSRMIQSYPSLKNVEFHLNEWGVCSHYEKTAREYPALEIRSSEFSACFFVKLADCLRQIGQCYGFAPAMMLYWGFCLEDCQGEIFAGHRDLMTAGHLPKPILTAFEMMARLGEKLLKTEGTKTGGPLGCIGAKNSEGIQILLYHFEEYQCYNQKAEGQIRLTDLPEGSWRIRRILLDREHHNTYRLWQRMGSPEKPDEKQLAELTEEARLCWDMEEWAEAEGGVLELSAKLPPQSIQLIEISRKEQE